MKNATLEMRLQRAASELTEEEKQNRNFVAKIVICGDAGCGKSTLLNSFKQAYPFLAPKKVTPMVGGARKPDNKNKVLNKASNLDYAEGELRLTNKDKCKVFIVDTPGAHEKRDSFLPALVGKNGAVVIFDINSYQSFQNADKWIKLIKGRSGSKVVISLIGNKLDSATQNETRQVDRTIAEAYCAENEISYSETAAINASSIIVLERLVKKVAYVHRDKKVLATQIRMTKSDDDLEVNAIVDKLHQIERGEKSHMTIEPDFPNTLMSGGRTTTDFQSINHETIYKSNKNDTGMGDDRHNSSFLPLIDQKRASHLEFTDNDRTNIQSQLNDSMDQVQPSLTPSPTDQK